MPQLPMNYKNSVIYKLCCKDVSITDCYVGSSTSFNKRKSQHKCACNNEQNKRHHLNVYQFIIDNGGWQNWDMIVVEDFPCESKNELHTRERYWLETLHATLNRSVPTRSKKEWREDNAERCKEKSKKYYEDNAGKFKEWCENNVERCKENKRKYYENNAEKLKEDATIYYEKNREEINAKAREKIQCPHCDKIMNRHSMEIHIKNIHTEKTKQQIACTHCDKIMNRNSMTRHIKTQHQ